MPPRKPNPSESERHVLTADVATFKALADPLRLQILVELSAGDRTVKEMAAILDVKPTSLYYHFKILQGAGLIRVVSRRLVSGIEERRYQGTATSWTMSPEATPAAVKSGIIGAILNMVRAELELAMLASPAPVGEPGSAVPFLSLSRLVLSEGDVETFYRRLASLLDRYSADTGRPKGKRVFHAFLATYLPPAELRNQAATTPETPPARKRGGRRAP